MSSARVAPALALLLTATITTAYEQRADEQPPAWVPVNDSVLERIEQAQMLDYYCSAGNETLFQAMPPGPRKQACRQWRQVGSTTLTIEQFENMLIKNTKLWLAVAGLRKQWCEREEVQQDAICAQWRKEDEAFLEREAQKRKKQAEGAAMGAWWCEGKDERESEVPCLEHQLKKGADELADIDVQIGQATGKVREAQEAVREAQGVVKEAQAVVRDLQQRRKETNQGKQGKDKELRTQIQKGSQDRAARAATVAKMELEYCTEGAGKERDGGSLICDAWKEKQAKHEL